MSTSKTLDAVVIGSGPNGLSAALVLAGQGLSVRVLEAQETLGGGLATQELTLPGFLHDICSAIHPLAAASPFFNTLRLGVSWVHPPVALAHPLDDAPAAVLRRSVRATAERLGSDAAAYERLVGSLVPGFPSLLEDILGPPRVPRHPFTLARFGIPGVLPASLIAQRVFREERSRALFLGLAAHSIIPLDRAGTSAFALVIALAGHAVGWPAPHGGAGTLAGALAARLQEQGGTIETRSRITSLAQLPEARVYLFDCAPRALADIAQEKLPASYAARLRRFRHGPGVYKLDWALDAPIPWRDPICAEAGTVHVGGSPREIIAAEAAPWKGEHAERPFVLLAQPTRFDASRAPAGKHVAWAYCHVPHGSTVDMTARIEAQVERFAPGFRERILARHAFDTEDLERRNPNLIGGDITGGANTLLQLAARPVWSATPYATPDPRIYLCSSSTPPGGGVHGMCGYHAARTALRRVFGIRLPALPRLRPDL